MPSTRRRHCSKRCSCSCGCGHQQGSWCCCRPRGHSGVPLAWLMSRGTTTWRKRGEGKNKGARLFDSLFFRSFFFEVIFLDLFRVRIFFSFLISTLTSSFLQNNHFPTYRQSLSLSVCCVVFIACVENIKQEKGEKRCCICISSLSHPPQKKRKIEFFFTKQSTRSASTPLLSSPPRTARRTPRRSRPPPRPPRPSASPSPRRGRGRPPCCRCWKSGTRGLSPKKKKRSRRPSGFSSCKTASTRRGRAACPSTLPAACP